jgi:predicted MFS family arabinose efflux permease
LGPLTASLIAAQIGYSYIFYAEALLAVLASLPLLGLPPGAPAPGGTAPPGFWFGAYARSARVFRSDRIVSEYTGLAVIYCTGIGIRRLALPAIVLVLYGRADAGLGGLVAALAAGGILGGLLAAALGRRNLDRCYLWLTLLEACTWTVVHFHVPYAALVATLFVAGIGEGATTALFFSRVQARLDPADLGRYFALLASTADAATVVGVLLASAVYADHVARWGPLAIAALILLPLVGARRILTEATPATTPDATG